MCGRGDRNNKWEVGCRSCTFVCIISTNIVSERHDEEAERKKFVQVDEKSWRFDERVSMKTLLGKRIFSSK